jgi:4,5-DOPA dioxygenase extradiol
MSNITQRMPAVFIGHGSPMNTLEDNRYTQAWRALGEALPHPKAILCISAHWVTPRTIGTAVTAMSTPKTIHDFGGFPKPLFDFQYPAPGSPELAQRVRELLAPTQVIADTQEWGLDHGTWSVLAHLYPKADIPVVQLSMDGALSAQQHYALAQRLAPLRDEGVLILGSGNVVHNLGRIQWGAGANAQPWGERFNDLVKAKIAAHDHAALMDYSQFGDDAHLSIPTPEHYWPFLYVMAQQQAGDAAKIITDGMELGSVSMLSVQV